MQCYTDQEMCGYLEGTIDSETFLGHIDSCATCRKKYFQHLTSCPVCSQFVTVKGEKASDTTVEREKEARVMWLKSLLY